MNHKLTLKFVLATLLIAFSVGSFGATKSNWVSITIDNDAFVGNDSGYSNGLFISFFDISDNIKQLPQHDFLVTPLMWSMPAKNITSSVNAYSFGQSLNTPSDIKIANPSTEELPYSALLALANSYITITPNQADIATTKIGIVGPAAFGEEAQTFIHKLIGANKPQGWDTQLHNEVVFEFSRARSYRAWVSQDDNIDILTSGSFSLGTLRSAIDVGSYIRYGNNLVKSHPTTLLVSSRITNPIAVDGWYVFAGARVGYMFNYIFTDGNTFRDSRSIDYEKRYVSLSAGFSYAWRNLSLTFAIDDANILQKGDQQEALKDLTRFGTISFAWKL